MFGAPQSPVRIPSPYPVLHETFHEENAMSLGTSGMSEMSGLTEFFQEVGSNSLAIISSGTKKSKITRSYFLLSLLFSSGII